MSALSAVTGRLPRTWNEDTLPRCHLGLGRFDLRERHAAGAREHLTAAGRLCRRANSQYRLAHIDEARTGLR
jgi:hypothetical protein